MYFSILPGQLFWLHTVEEQIVMIIGLKYAVFLMFTHEERTSTLLSNV